MSFLPTGPYTIILTIGVILGAILAFTGRDRRLRWPAGAMILSLVAARAATAFPEAALGILLVVTPLCAWLAISGPPRRLTADGSYDLDWTKPAAIKVIAIVYVPRLLCYAANAFSLLDRAMMWEFSNFFLIIQIAALFAGTWAGGHVVLDRMVLGSGASPRRSVYLPRSSSERNRAE